MSDRTEELRDAVIEAAGCLLANTSSAGAGSAHIGAAAWEWLRELRQRKQALDDHLKPDPLRDAVALLRRARVQLYVDRDAQRIANDIDEFLAALDKDGARDRSGR